MSPEAKRKAGSYPSDRDGHASPGQGRPALPLPAVLAVLALVVVGVAAVFLLRAPAATSTANASANPLPTRSALATTTAVTSQPATADPTAKSANANAGNKKIPVAAPGGVVKLLAADVADGRAHYYTYQGARKTIPFFVLKSSDGVIRAAFDACDVCFSFKKGYHQEGDEMVCNNCGTRFPSVNINVLQGGCNPAPLARQLQADTLIITVADVEAGARYF